MIEMQLSSSFSSSFCFSSANLDFQIPGSARGHRRRRHRLKLVPSLCPMLSVSNSRQLQLPLKQSVAAIVFGGGSESRLEPLTKTRSKGAIPIAANYRLVDAVISNCIHNDVSKIYAITQFNSTSLNSHLARAYSGLGLGKEGFVEVIAAYQSPEDQGWFQGNADAIRRCLWVFEEFPVTEFLILPGHHLYRMDYKKIIEAHRHSRADITIVGLSSVTDRDPGFGLMEVDAMNNVIRFTIKPQEERTDLISVESTRRSDEIAYSIVPSTGIYIVSREEMVKLLTEHFSQANDFASEVIPDAVSEGMKVKAYMFDGYWEDMKSIRAFYRANLGCIKISNLGYNFYDRDCPLYTIPRCLPPSSISEAIVTNSVIGDGCILNRCIIKGSVVGMRTRIADDVVVEDSVIMGSDIYETEEDVRRYSAEGKGSDVRIGIGEKTRIRKAIVDKNARIGNNVTIINRDDVQEGDREFEGYVIKEGIVVILRGALIPNHTII